MPGKMDALALPVFRENLVAIYTHDRRLWIWIYPWISTENLWIWIWMANFISTASLLISVEWYDIIRADSCARAEDDGRVDLTRCLPISPHNLRSLTFELQSSGRLLTGGGNGSGRLQQCLTVQHNSYVLLNACSAALYEQQRWTYDQLTGSVLFDTVASWRGEVGGSCPLPL